MNVLQINTAADSGGAGRAMVRLHQGLARRGHNSQLLARLRRTPQPQASTIVEAIGGRQSAPARFVNNARMQLDAWFSLPTVHNSTQRLLDTELFRQADVVHLHNLHGWYFNYHLLPRLTAARPVIWTLHDMWAITGHCAYSYRCGRWRTGCFDCPLLRGEGRKRVEPRPALLDRTAQVWQDKRDLYRQSALHVVAPSRWLAELATAGILGDAQSIRCIPYGLDLEVFRPLDRRAARQALGVPQDAKVVLFVAAKVTQKRKGLAFLLDALGRIQDVPSLLLLTVGAQGSIGEQLRGFEQIHLGNLADETTLNRAYNAADVYVSPTLADNLPLVVMESLAAGTPVAAFDVGGVPEMIHHMKTGYLARYQDAADLARGMRTLLDDDEQRTRMGQQCRAFAQENYDLDLQARRYVELYRQAIEQHLARKAVA